MRSPEQKNIKTKRETAKQILINGKTLTLSKEEILKAFRTMFLSRQMDKKSMNLLKQGKTFFHIAGSGHEAIQIAAGMQLNPHHDWIFPYYRDLGVVLTCGVNPYDVFLQCFAKADDPSSGGRQLPCHYGARGLNIPSQSSPTGTQYLHAVGAALASQHQGIKNVTYVSSGEGTTSQGEFHEAVNWASREKLPVIFVVQNNKYAISVHVSKQSGGEGNSIAEMMKGYAALKRMLIDGTDFVESYVAFQEAVEYAGSGEGPVLIEADVVRLLSHSSSDDQKKYREHDELEDEAKRDPVEKMILLLKEYYFVSEEEIQQIKTEVLAEIENAVTEAVSANDSPPESCEKYVFDESGLKDTFNYEATGTKGNPIVMVDAINHALHEEMELNNKTYLFGEDVADKKGGVFTATKGLTQKFGDKRVFNSPLAEASIIGVATGMALTGLKPIVEIQFGDYIWPAFMQFKNEVATMRYRSNNSWSASFVTRVAVGGYIHGGLCHSQNIESIFAHIPGIYIAYPSNAADAKGLLKTAIRLNDPVLFCEHKGLYRQSFATSPEPDKNYLIPFGEAKVVKKGKDVSIITYGASVWDALFAIRKLEDEGHSVEVIDIRTIIPLDEETIFKSVKKTGKAIVIHEDTFTSGFGAEIAARISDTCFQHLDAPVKRVAAKDVHIPYSPILENAALPSREGIYQAIKELIRY
ncbi:MAG: tungsten formylmethanofuran dehydrogenase [Ignavibacteria bacterium CG22_combo_CG10-13_8_21_14_all_37_15]|nr:tungsten formylmethanofuran dehydrogenase [Ignavibacteria bacterium]PIP77777.1 MAG: tungsten formylmethanofuran dehydrogenase [Ignavibacteria bacterium CG22_combo_CG10-13_8_21_14_all_37_15]PIS45643.1 MAG: tungsten formylmethanofuran dehydrogenase [Ignavibacteria bacterium CG08_land_8_20_14_0_20_37_9]PIX94132.1 MAG: tungsten formylmethanofuran dehydrogenase [Ignavibacteria bacterium CG_4_10_14_3_um_filter_37_18]PJC60319.1 MAG: tungsten formylmethanofuran dehydrogenase [Ignavibacteria bacteriu